MFLYIRKDGTASLHIMEKGYQVLNRDDYTIQIKIPGHRINMSGIRGMPDYRYVPVQRPTYRITQTEKVEDNPFMVEMLTVEECEENLP